MRAGVVEADLVSIDLSRHDPVAQTVTTSHLYVAENGVSIYPVKMRYAWPPELDSMARLAGLKLRDRSSRLAGQSLHVWQPPPRVGVGATVMSPRSNSEVVLGRNTAAPVQRWQTCL